MFDAALDGELKALYVFGEDIAQTDPDTAHGSRRRCDACELVVSQEIFLSRTAERADVVLPGRRRSSRRTARSSTSTAASSACGPAVPPPGEARTDFEIIKRVARALGADLGCPTPADAMDELRLAVRPLYAGISHAAARPRGPAALALPLARRTRARPPLYLERLRDPERPGPARGAPYLPPGEEPDADYPFILVTGRRLEHYNAGTMTRRTANLELLPEELLEINPADAARLGVARRRRASR